MPLALSALWAAVNSKVNSNKEKLILIKEFDKVLALDLTKVKTITIPKKIQELVKKRENARKNKEWDLSDKLREEIKSKGFIVEDAESSSKLKKIK